MGKNLFIIALIALVLTLLFWGRNDRKTLQKAQSDLLELASDKIDLVKVIDDKGREIASTKAIVLSKDKEIEQNLKTIEELKDLQSKIVVRTVNRYDTLRLALHDTTLIIKQDTIVGSSFSHQDEWLSIGGNIANDSLILDSLVVRNKYSIEIGSAKVGLFKRETKAFLTNENPHASTEDLTTFVLKPDKKWYNRSGWKIGIGLVGGFLIARKL